MYVIDTYGKRVIIQLTKKLGKELIKEASPEYKLRVYAYVRVPTILGECLSEQSTNHKKPL